MQYLNNSYLQVNVNKISENWKTVSNSLPTGTVCIPVLKCNAYGLGLVPVAQELIKSGASVFALAQVGEGVNLRKAGITDADVFILGGVPDYLFSAAVHYNIGLSVFHPHTAYLLNEECKKQNIKKFSVQIKIETGLNRTGVKPGAELTKLIEALKNCKNLSVSGVFSHFSEGELYGSKSAKAQYALFCKAVLQLSEAGINPPLVHICNSGASEWFKEAVCTGVRIGRRLYTDNQQHPGENEPIEEVCSWRTSITNMRFVKKGECVGYDGAWVAQRDSKIAIACVGYGDGLYPLAAQAHAPVLVNDSRAHLIATCMDQSFIDVTDVGCKVGDEVTFFGESKGGEFISVQEIAALVKNEGVYLTSLLTDRVKRVYI